MHPKIVRAHPSWRRDWLVPLLFSPPGCVGRVLLSRMLNRDEKFCYGTFMANVVATMGVGVCWAVENMHGGRLVDDGTGRNLAVVRGVQEGFCGCLSTVSTWVAEMDRLARRGKAGWAWLYGGVSVGVGLGALLLLCGPVRWE